MKHLVLFVLRYKASSHEQTADEAHEEHPINTATVLDASSLSSSAYHAADQFSARQ